MKKAGILAIVLLIFKTSISQFTDTTTRFIRFSSTGILNKTNDGRSYVLTNGLSFSVRKKSVVFNSGANWIYGEQQGRISNNDFSSSIDFNLYKTFPNFYYWGLGTFEKSVSLRLNKRVQMGLGVAYNFIDNAKAYINLSDGIIYETSDLKLTDSTNDVYQTFRNSLRLRFRFVIQEKITIDATNYWQPSLSNSKDYIIRSSGSIGVKLYKWLNFTTALTYNRLNRTQRENLLLTVGLTMETYF